MEAAKQDVYTIVNERIIEQLEKGVIPWRQTWKEIGPPRNYITQRPYRGLNYLLLNSLNYPLNEFLTFKQIQDLGGKVKKGEKANLVILWIWVEEQGEKRNHKVEGRKYPLMRYYFVFNVAQCINLPQQPQSILQVQNHPLQECERIVSRMPNCPRIVHNENEAYYHTVGDFINMPKIELFDSSEAYYATLFHELIHATGSESRLARKEIVEHTSFGSELYSIEELTAEIGACYLTSYVGIAPLDLANNVAYIKSWLKRLKEDKKFIVYASSHAQRAVDYILNVKHDESDFIASNEIGER